MRKMIFIAALALLATAGAHSPHVHASEGKVGMVPAIPGVLEASAIAYRDFESKLASKGGGSSGLERHLYNIDNYSLKAYASGDSFVVEFIPMPLNGGSLRGGGAKYVVDAKSEEILNYSEYR